MPSSDLFSDRIVAPHQRRIPERESGEDQFELDILVERTLQPLQLIDHVSQAGLLQGFTEFPDHLQLINIGDQLLPSGLPPDHQIAEHHLHGTAQSQLILCIEPALPLLYESQQAGSVLDVGHPQKIDDLFTGLPDRSESTRLNSSHVASSYAVFCLKKET